MNHTLPFNKREAEGGCGVIGIASSVPAAGKFLLRPLEQMHNRGNGKGGGIAAAGCFPGRENDYAIQVGFLDSAAVGAVENEVFDRRYVVTGREEIPTADDYRDVPGIEVEPPRVIRWFCRAREDELGRFMRENGYEDAAAAEDEFVFRISGGIDERWYPADGGKRAFVLSHGKDIQVLKGVGYAESIARYYLLDDIEAHIWIGHQRYPTRGRVWHPGGAHPFIGVHSALVHNGDLANYHSIVEYLAQKGLTPRFQTDTEVAALLFDYYTRTLRYPIEYAIEATAPTTERDFDMLPKGKQRLYRAIRAAHIHGSPDGPWFFIIARNNVAESRLELIAITDTSMLRPQVFALSRGAVDIGVVASEKQAVDAFLQDFAASGDGRGVCPVADHVWVARGGSHTDGGAFIFSLGASRKELTCVDKFNHPVEIPGDLAEPADGPALFAVRTDDAAGAEKLLGENAPEKGFPALAASFRNDSYEACAAKIAGLADAAAREPLLFDNGRILLTMVHDRGVHYGEKKRKWIVALAEAALNRLFSSLPAPATAESPRGDAGSKSGRVVRFGVDDAGDLSPFAAGLHEDAVAWTVAVDAGGFPVEGKKSAAAFLVEACNRGFRKFLVFNLAGHRFLGCGLGPESGDVIIHLHGSSGDYAGSGLDGAELHIHGDAQDQVGQIFKSGKIIIHGSVGQTFLYGAKGGEAYVLGSTAGRPLINAVGSIRAIVNGTCLDYAAESFMAGESTGGGFLLINGLWKNIYGEVMGMEERFPGGNFFSLASGGAGYINDPYRSMTEDQLNGAKFVEFKQKDWLVIEKYLKNNENLFGISINGDILTVDRIRKWPQEIYRKVAAVSFG